MPSLSSTTDPRIPPRDVCVTRYVLERFARETPNKVFAVFQDGEEWTYSALLDRVRALAGGLASQGVERGDHVAVWMFDSKEAILTFLGINYLGAVFVPLNTAFKGAVLEHVLNVSDARHLVVHGQLIDRLEGINVARVERLIHVGASANPQVLEQLDFASLTQSGAQPPSSSRP